MKRYVNCPKCGDEFDFVLRIECDGLILCEEEKQNCRCKLTDEEMETLVSEACSKIE